MPSADAPSADAPSADKPGADKPSTPVLPSPGTVAVVGCGMVGASFAYALVQRSLATELLLVDANPQRAEGEAMDLQHGLAFVRPMRIRAVAPDALAAAKVVVVCAGANQRPGETRLDLLAKNAAVFRAVIPQILAANPQAIIVIATNPVDILTQLAVEVAGNVVYPGQIIGSGTILDTARLRTLLAEHYRVDPRSVHAQVVAEHGDSSVALYGSASIGGIGLADFVGPTGQSHAPDHLQRVLGQVQTAAYEVISRKGSTYYAIGLGLLSIVEAIVRDSHSVLTVSGPLTGQYGVSGMALSLPCVVGGRGIEQVLSVPMTDAELAGFQASAKLLLERFSLV
jgi:L-lactate dehydrogenase